MKFGTTVTCLVIAVLAVGSAAAIWRLARFGQPDTAGAVSVKIPALSTLALTGKSAFDANCATCHGPHAAGTVNGPPLVHDIYNPGHHTDEAFVLAASRGVRRHHWRYGDMPPQTQVTPTQLGAIIRYVREMQVANGIAYRPHRI